MNNIPFYLSDISKMVHPSSHNKYSGHVHMIHELEKKKKKKKQCTFNNWGAATEILCFIFSAMDVVILWTK